MEIPICADESLSIGNDLVGKIQNVTLATLDAESVLMPDISFHILIREEEGAYTILDENSTEEPQASNGEVDVKVLRTINANEWSTICLPFAMTAEQVKAAFGNDVKLSNFIGCDTQTDEDENITGINVKFENVASIDANHPYLINVSKAITEFTVDGVDIEVEDEPSVDCDRIGKGTKKDPYIYNSFVGTYVANTEVPENTLFLSGNKFWYSTGATKMKAFRGYFDFYDILTSVEGAEAKICLTFDDSETTDINYRISPLDSWHSDMYNINGQKVGKNYKGIVIVDGQKKVIKK